MFLHEEYSPRGLFAFLVKLGEESPPWWFSRHEFLPLCWLHAVFLPKDEVLRSLAQQVLMLCQMADVGAKQLVCLAWWAWVCGLSDSCASRG